MYAKTEPPVSLKTHSLQVANTITELVEKSSIETFLKEYDFNKKEFKNIAYKCGLFHDSGKAHPEWQKECEQILDEEQNKEKFKPPNHSARSSATLLNVLNNCEDVPEKLTNAGIIAVLHHHTNYTNRNMKTSEISKVTENKEYNKNLDTVYKFSDETPQLNENDIIKLKKLRKNIPDFYDGKFGILVHMLLSLLVQTDHYCSQKIKVDRDPIELLPTFGNKNDFSLFDELRPFQMKIQNNLNKNSLLAEAGCGEGKTHAACQWSKAKIENKDAERIVFALPTKTTANNILMSLQNNLINTDIGIHHSGIRHLLESNDELDKNKINRRRQDWFQEAYTVTTVDHVLNTMINNYKKSSIARGNLLRSAVIFDELHAYDEFTISKIISCINYFNKIGIPWMITSATIPNYIKNNLPSKRTEIISDGKINRSKTRENYQIKTKDTELTVRSIKEKITDTDYDRVMVVKNTVNSAKEIVKKLKPKSEYKVMYYSGEFPTVDRSKKEKQIEDMFGIRKEPDNNNKTKILISTQVCEISLNIDVDIMLSDPCPIDSFLQRSGRVHREGEKDNSEECSCLACGKTKKINYSAIMFQPPKEPPLYPYTDEKDNVWDLIQTTYSYLKNINHSYNFKSSVNWINSCYNQVNNFTLNTTSFRKKIQDDMLYGTDRVGDRTQIRKIVNYKYSVLAQNYSRKNKNNNLDFSDIKDKINSRSQAYKAFNDYSIPVPTYLINDENNNIKIVKKELYNGIKVPVCNVDYNIELGVIYK